MLDLLLDQARHDLPAELLDCLEPAAAIDDGKPPLAGLINQQRFLQPVAFDAALKSFDLPEVFPGVILNLNGFPQNKSAEIIETLIDLIKTKLAASEDVLISGFGKFCVKEKRQRRGRNPATGEAMMLDARRVVTFKCSGQLRDKINQSQ